MLRKLALAISLGCSGGQIMAQPSKVLQEFESIYALFTPPQEKTPECCLWLTGLHNPFCNIVQHCSYSSGLTERVDALMAQDPTGTLSFWVDRTKDAPLIAILEAKHFQNIGTFPLMDWKCVNIGQPHGYEIRPVDFAECKSIIAELFCLEGETLKGYANLMRSPNATHYLLYCEGKPVCTGTLLISGNVGGVFNIATLPAYQKRGFGRAMSQFLMHRAWEKQLHRLILISSPGAHKLYASLGFKVDANMEVYSRCLEPVVSHE
jgi:GNAT superfamily N-acetyltransferase